MTASVNHRIAAAFQEGKDPQQEAVIRWMRGLPKDARGGVKRSVFKYHLTRALLMYIQSGADTTANVLSASSANVASAPVVYSAPPAVGVVSSSELRTSPRVDSGQSTVPNVNPVSKPSDVRSSLRSKIAMSMTAS